MNTKLNTDNISDILGTTGSPKRKRKKRWLIIPIILLMAGAAVFLFAQTPGNGARMEFVTAEVIKGDITVQVSATGTLEPTNTVDVGSELSGTITEVLVDFNSRVTKGQVLAKIDTTKLDAQVFQYEAALKAAMAKVDEAKATEEESRLNLNRMKKLWIATNKMSPSQADMATAEAEYAIGKAETVSAEASVMQAEANLRVEKADLSKAIVTSPVDGIVLDKEIEAGQTVAASYETPTLFTIAEDLRRMELIVNVDEADIGQVQEGQKAVFTVDAHPNKSFEGTIIQTRFGSTITDNVVTYETVIKVDNSELLLRPGMTATADIIVKEVKDAVQIPKAALRFTPPKMEEPSGSILSKLIPGRGGPPGGRKRPGGIGGPPGGGGPSARGSQARYAKMVQPRDDGGVTVWILRDNRPQPVRIKVGEAVGSYRQLLTGDIRAGDKLITGTLGDAS